MVRFGKYQWYTSKDLQSLGKVGKLYASLVGYTQIGGYGRSLWFRKVLRMKNISFKNALDAGCGRGEYVFYLAERFPNAHITGVDYDPENISECLKVKSINGLANCSFKLLDLRKLDDEGRYDFIYSIDVLEHIAENREVLYRFYKALRPGGILYIRMPTPIQKRIFPERFFTSHHLWAEKEHIGQHYDLPDLERELKDMGFSIDFSDYTNGLWGRLAFEIDHILRERSRLLAAICVPLLKFLFFLDLVRLKKKEGNGIVVVALKEG